MKKGFPLGGSCPRSGLMRGNAANIAYLYLPHTRPPYGPAGPPSVYALRAAYGGCAPTRACGRSPSEEGLGVLCPTRGCLFVQLFRQYHHQQQHDKQRPGVELHRDILRQDAEKWR